MRLRQVAAIHTFTSPARLEALSEALAWLGKNGYSYGSPCSENKIGIVQGDGIFIGKWQTLSRDDIARLDGVLAGDIRSNTLTLTLYRPDPSTEAS